MPTTSTRLWVPRRVLVTRSAAELPHTAQILVRCADAGVTDVEFLASDRLSGLRVAGADGTNERATYARAESTLAVVVSPPAKRQLQPIPPSADRRGDLAEGCPADCWFGEELERRLPAARPLYWT